MFHQPALVLADTDVLDTLSEREFRAGYAEVVKYGLIDRPDFFEWLERTAPRSSKAARHASRRWPKAAAPRRRSSRATSARTATAPSSISGTRSATRWNRSRATTPARLVHGEGVSVGMALAHRFSVALGLCSGQDAGRAEAHLKAAGLPTRIQDIPGGGFTLDALMDKIAQDKKVSRGR